MRKRAGEHLRRVAIGAIVDTPPAEQDEQGIFHESAGSQNANMTYFARLFRSLNQTSTSMLVIRNRELVDRIRDFNEESSETDAENRESFKPKALVRSTDARAVRGVREVYCYP